MSTPSLNCRLMCASAAAYCINPKSKKGDYSQYNPCGKDNPQYNAIGFTEDPYVISDLQIEACLVGKTKTELILAFRGTLKPGFNWDAILDWLQDLIAIPVENVYLPGKVHTGFLFALLSLADNIKKAIDALDPEHTLPLYITGHSKGGGMAPIAAMYLKNRYNIIARQTVTIAGPNPGNHTFAASYNADFPNDIRYENYLDIVPILPPIPFVVGAIEDAFPLPDIIKDLLNKAKAWDYARVGNLKYIDANENVISVPDSEENALLLVRVAEIGNALKELDFSAVANAHSSACGGGYMNGICDGNVCK